MKYFILFAFLALTGCKDNTREIQKTEKEIEIAEKNLGAAIEGIELGKKWERDKTINQSKLDSAYFKKRLDSLETRLKDLE